MDNTPWGCDSDYGVLRDVALRSPEHFGWFGANAVAKETLRKGITFDAKLAADQHAAFVAAFEDAGVRVHMVDPDPALRYHVYTRDPAIVTPWGVLIGQMQREQRRGEVAPTVRFHQKTGIPIWNWVTAGSLEGGDVHLLRPGVAAIGMSGNRTTKEGAEQAKAWFEAEGWECRIVPIAEHFLHLDLLISMVTESLALVCTDVVEPEIVNWLAELGIKAVPTTYADAMRLAGNCLSLGDDRVISSAEAETANAQLRSLGIKVYDPALTMFTLAGGGPRCLSQPLRRESVKAG
ncbi:dimethylarginine dimethylaminohydrolase family protein [Thalassobaculum litoreum]|uniref:arginine deiminase n=1 Tax=Thalassobaculum litoreum DSM 18839 TaxID=1123362 RepID=A0A8G2BN07_9PROT|nr:arginine deiminase family protein [Thalassobaculum litoreum]SDG55493.1 N-Dimethylarginine dimethylaminohydrolase [Thalassobaculum litoreum DSM 18839]